MDQYALYARAQTFSRVSAAMIDDARAGTYHAHNYAKRFDRLREIYADFAKSDDERVRELAVRMPRLLDGIAELARNGETPELHQRLYDDADVIERTVKELIA
jgi:hypothetical protein